MYAITGITGKVGCALARELLKANQPVRAIVRDAAKGEAWRALGCEVAMARMEDSAALTAAFSGATGVFILPPSEFDPAPGFPEARAVISAVTEAIAAAAPGKVVCLSTIGAQASRINLLTQRTLMEQSLRTLAIPLTFLRPGWFMDNAARDVASACDQGLLRSFLQPLDKAVPMIATADVGQVAAQLLQETWSGQRIVELDGPRVAPDDLAEAFARVLGRPVQAQVVSREGWEAQFRGEGARNPGPRMRMLDGFNEGWIDFEGGAAQRRMGATELLAVVRELIMKTR